MATTTQIRNIMHPHVSGQIYTNKTSLSKNSTHRRVKCYAPKGLALEQLLNELTAVAGADNVKYHHNNGTWARPSITVACNLS